MARQQDDDDYGRWLQTVELDQLDLESIDAGEQPQDTGTPVWRLLGLISAIGAIIYLPHNAWYQLHADTWLLWTIATAGLFLGISTSRWLWAQALIAQERAANAPKPRLPEPQLPRIPPKVMRWLMLMAAITLGCVLYFALPHDAVWMGNGYASDWFWGVGVALTIGILLGRWLIAQASAAPKKPIDRTPIRLPPWFKWANLMFLIVGALFALFGNEIFGDGGSNSLGFGMSGVGLFVGIFGAIWLSRRFDEMEARLSARTRAQAATFKIGENR